MRIFVRRCHFVGDVDVGAGGRAVECTGLENRRTLTRLVGSNPTLPVGQQSVDGRR
jgi:hypothetical protein